MARTLAMLGLFILCRAMGNLSLAWGTKHFSGHLSINPLIYVAAMVNPFVSAGILMLVLSMLTRMALFSLADLSYILPVTAVGYVLSALLGVWILGEKVTPVAWLGTLLIFAGAAVVTSTPRLSAEVNEMAAGNPRR